MQKRIGIAVHNIHEEYCVELLKGVQKYCKDFCYQLFVFPINAKYSSRFGFEYRHSAIRELINEHNLDGLILSSATLSSFITNEEFVKDCKLLNPLPLVHVGVKIPGQSCVTSDSEEAFKLMLLHIIEKHGKKNFLLLNSYDSNIDSLNRTKWVMEILKEHNIQIPKHRIINCDFNKNRAKLRIKEYIMSNGVDFDCVISLNDSMAFGAIQGLEECQIKVPDDVLLTGFDNSKGATYSTPTLTSIDPQISEQGYKACQLLSELMEDSTKTEWSDVKSEVRFRESCGCIAGQNYKIDYIDEKDCEHNYSNEEIYNIIHKQPEIVSRELYSLHQLTLNSMTVVNMNELFTLLPDYIERISLPGIAVFTYPYPRKFTPSSVYFKIPDQAKRIFSYELGTLKANLKDVSINPKLDFIPEGTFNTEFDTIVVYPLFETQMQYGYMLVPLIEHNCLYYEIILELFAKEITSAIRLDIEEKENSKLENSNTKLKKYSSALSVLSTTDELTQINNRRGFLSLAEKEIKKDIANNKTGMIIFCDMDGMKKINDTYGHDAGDRAIRAEVEILQRACRSSDIIGRLGGDEFAVYVEGMDELGFISFKNRIKNETNFVNNRNREPFNISMSLGCAQVSAECHNINKLLILADKELYKEKKIKKEKNK